MSNQDEVTGVTLLQKVVREEIEKDPEHFMDTLYEIAKRKVVEEHHNDMMTAVGLLFLFTKEKPTSPAHQGRATKLTFAVCRSPESAHPVNRRELVDSFGAIAQHRGNWFREQ